MNTSHRLFDRHPITLDTNGRIIVPSSPSSGNCNETAGDTNVNSSSTLYMPIASPPTPAPSPGPSPSRNMSLMANPPPFAANLSHPYQFSPLGHLDSYNANLRLQYLSTLLSSCTPSELLFISTTIAPLLKRDFLHALPPELALHILSFIDDPKTLARASQVSRHWHKLLGDEAVWKRLCEGYAFDVGGDSGSSAEVGMEKGKGKEDDDEDEPLEEMEQFAVFPMDPALEWVTARKRQARKNQRSAVVSAGPPGSRILRPDEPPNTRFSHHKFFKYCYTTMMNWRHGGRLLRAHRVPVVTPDSGVITSVALDADWVVVGLANCKIHIFSAKTGVLSRTLVGHDLGVWGVCLVSKGGEWGGGADGEGSGPGRRDEGERGTTDIGAGGSTNGRRDKTEWTRKGVAVGPGLRRGRWGDADGTDVHGLSVAIGSMSLRDDTSSSGASTVSPGLPPEELDHLVPPSLRTALGLDANISGSATGDGRQQPQPQLMSIPVTNGESSRLPASSSPGAGKRSDVCFASEGWGQPNALVVSGGCDKMLRVWDVKTGYCIYVLPGHSSTIRCIRVLHNRPIAVTGSRDSTLRVWDVQRGRMLRVLSGHLLSVRCLDVCGNKAVSGSYDTTCRLWNVDTGECLHVLRGHFHQIYSVAFDGVRIASGGLDTTVRVWDADTGQCIALLQGHTALVCQLQLSPTILATGGSDGRVITFSLSTYTVLHRIAAHDSSVTSLQFDKHFLVTGGNDGRVRLFETETGSYVRELSDPSESVWKVVYRHDTCAVMCKRAGKTVMEIWSLKPR